LHGGWITATSGGPGQGSQFRFGVPLLRAVGPRDASLPAPVAAAVAPAAAGATTVLVADDNADAAWGIAKLLELAGHQVRVAGGGAEALRMLREHRPAVALIDIGMPDIDGHEVARQLRATEGDGRTMLIATTGWGQDQDVRDTLASGFDAHLTKPLDIGQLRKLIDEHGAQRQDGWGPVSAARPPEGARTAAEGEGAP